MYFRAQGIRKVKTESGAKYHCSFLYLSTHQWTSDAEAVMRSRQQSRLNNFQPSSQKTSNGNIRKLKSSGVKKDLEKVTL